MWARNDTEVFILQLFWEGGSGIRGTGRKEIPEHPVIADMERFGYVRGWKIGRGPLRFGSDVPPCLRGEERER